MMRTINVLNILVLLNIKGILLAGIYTISGDHKYFLIPILLVCLAQVCCLVILTIYEGCSTKLTKLTIAASAFAMTSDVLILSMALFHTIGIIRLQQDTRAFRGRSMSYLLVKQGVLRFTVIFSWGIENLIQNKLVSATYQNFGITMQNCVSVLLVCRFLLDLRELNSQCNAIDATSNVVTL